jgi:eukaryotic-like serine/threonine-protein kinase
MRCRYAPSVRVCPKCLQVYGDEAGFCAEDGASLQRSEDKLLGRTIASRYRLLKRLGTGGMSTVYLARHVVIDRLAAIKILRPEYCANATYRERFLREAKAVNRINHRNVVEIDDVGEAEGIAYLVMEYVSGLTLLERLKAGILTWREALQVAMQVASALTHVHQAGVIHRDLKPENVLLTDSDDGGLFVKLTDFGIAKLSDMPAITHSEQLFGTPGYIAPELIEGREASVSTDVYALGAMTYEMITGQLPFTGKGQAELLLKPLSSLPTPIAQHVQGLPRGVQFLVMRMLARKPEERPIDAGEIVETCRILLREAVETSSAPFDEVGPDTTPSDNEENDQATGSIPTSNLLPPRDVHIEDAPATISKVEPATVSRPRHSLSPPTMPQQAGDWLGALTELEASVARSLERGQLSAALARQAAEHAQAAREMLPRVERAQQVAKESLYNVDVLQQRGRTFRGSLGKALDALLRDRSRERMRLEAVRTRRSVVAVKMPTSTDTALWEAASLAAEEDKSLAIEADLSFQIATLQTELDRQNEVLERELLDASGHLEGALSALRTLTSELVRMLERAALAAGANPKHRPAV